jgi:hypothetical protein
MTDSPQIIVDEQEGIVFGPFATYEIAVAFLDEVHTQSNINISDFNIHEVASVEEWVSLFQDIFPHPNKLIEESK